MAVAIIGGPSITALAQQSDTGVFVNKKLLERLARQSPPGLKPQPSSKEGTVLEQPAQPPKSGLTRLGAAAEDAAPASPAFAPPPPGVLASELAAARRGAPPVASRTRSQAAAPAEPLPPPPKKPVFETKPTPLAVRLAPQDPPVSPVESGTLPVETSSTKNAEPETPAAAVLAAPSAGDEEPPSTTPTTADTAVSPTPTQTLPELAEPTAQPADSDPDSEGPEAQSAAFPSDADPSEEDLPTTTTQKTEPASGEISSEPESAPTVVSVPPPPSATDEMPEATPTPPDSAPVANSESEVAEDDDAPPAPAPAPEFAALSESTTADTAGMKPPPVPEPPPAVAAPPSETAMIGDTPPPPPPPSAMPAAPPSATMGRTSADERANDLRTEQLVAIPTEDEPGAPPRILFEPGSSSLSGPAREALRRVAGTMARQEELAIEVQAYAAGLDARRLSLNRALVVRRFLADLGITPTRVFLRPLGRPRDASTPDRVDILRVDR